VQCPLPRVKRTCIRRLHSVACDPQRHFATANYRVAKGLLDHLVGAAEQRERESSSSAQVKRGKCTSLQRGGKRLVFAGSTDCLNDCSSGECRLKTAIIIDRRRLVAFAATCAVTPAFSRLAFAQAWPTRPVRLVVPYAPGGSTDTVARITADRLSKTWGQQLVIENKPGAGTNIGAAAVASSDADGYTMFIGTPSLATSRLLYRSLPYAISDLAPVTLVCTFPLLMVVPNSSPAKSVAEFIAFAREKKGKVTFASPGVGTVPHLAGELFKRLVGIEMTHVPYRGDAPALTDTIAGRVDLQIGGSAMLEQIRGGQIRGLAVTTAKRSKLAPELPTVAEAGVPEFDVMGWFAFFVPARTPRAIVEKIHVDTVTALSDPIVKAKFENIGMVAVGSTPDELANLLGAETKKWSPVIQEANIALD
jgi:tripartite-type tricarboxylate transporter receptor subunit TctC